MDAVQFPIKPEPERPPPNQVPPDAIKSKIISLENLREALVPDYAKVRARLKNTH